MQNCCGGGSAALVMDSLSPQPPGISVAASPSGDELALTNLMNMTNDVLRMGSRSPQPLVVSIPASTSSGDVSELQF